MATKKKTSIHDIAKQLNISATTISFVLNGKADEKRISEELRKKILDHVKSVGYRPNLVAKSLRTGKSKIIGMLVEDISDPFFSSISRIIEGLAYKNGYRIFYASTENDTEKAKALLRVFRERQVDGYIIAPSPGLEEEIKELQEDKLPVILFDRALPGISANTVVIDNFEGAYQGTRHLQNNGYAQVGFVTLDSQQTQMNDRLQGYLKAMEERKNNPCILKIPYGAAHAQSVELINPFLGQHPELDAILFATNYLAISGIKAINDRGLSIPGNIAIVGFDDNTHFNLFTPSISAVAQPIEEIAAEVVNQLMSCLKNEDESLKKRVVILPTKLIVRDSSVAKSKEKERGAFQGNRTTK